MRNPIVATLSIIFVALLAISCAASIIGVWLQTGQATFMASLPGIGATIICAVIGCWLIVNRLAPLRKIQEFAEEAAQGKKANLHIGQCGSFIPLAQAVYGLNKMAADRDYWYKSILDGLPWAIAGRPRRSRQCGSRFSPRLRPGRRKASPHRRP